LTIYISLYRDIWNEDMSGNLLEEQLKALSHQVRRDILSWLKQPELYFAD